MSKRFKTRRSSSRSKASSWFDFAWPVDMSVPNWYGTYTADDFRKYIGEWIQFKTPWGTHRGIVEKVKGDAVLVKMRSDSVPARHVAGMPQAKADIQLAGFVDGPGVDGCFPVKRRGLWCWCWFPIIIVVFFCFCW